MSIVPESELRAGFESIFGGVCFHLELRGLRRKDAWTIFNTGIVYTIESDAEAERSRWIAVGMPEENIRVVPYRRVESTLAVESTVMTQ